MSGPIVREGRVILSVELQLPNGGAASPVIAELTAQQEQLAVATGESTAALVENAASTEALYEALPPLTDAQLAAVTATDADTTATTENTAAKLANAEASKAVAAASAGAVVETGAAAVATVGATGALVGFLTGTLEVIAVLGVLYLAYEKGVEWYHEIVEWVNRTAESEKARTDGLRDAEKWLGAQNEQLKIELDLQRALANLGDNKRGKDSELTKQLLSAQQDRQITTQALVDTGDKKLNAANAGTGLVSLENQKALIQDIVRLKKEEATEEEKKNKEQQRAIEQAEKKREAAEKKLENDRHTRARGGGHHARTIEEDQRALELANQNLNSLTGGKTAQQALKELQDTNDTTIKVATQVQDRLNSLLSEVLTDIAELKKVQAQAKEGSRQAKK